MKATYLFGFLFLLISSSIFFGANYLASCSMIRFFGLNGQTLRLYAILISVFLGLTFPVASLLIHWKDNLFVRYFYITAGFWLGLLANLLLAIFLIWLISKLPFFALSPTKTSLLAAFFFVLAVVISIYGAWNAFNPRVKNLEIKIADLPSEWQGKTVVQLSDIHLGVVHRQDFMQKVVDITNQIKPEAVFITGDLFDGMDGDLSQLADPINDFLAKQGVFFITGNHETYLGESETLKVLEKTKARVLNNEIVDINGLQIIGLKYESFNGKSDIKALVESLPNFKKGEPSILLYHTPTNIAQSQELGINLQLSGHTHHGQIWPVHFFEWLIYGKYYYGLYQSGNYTFYSSSGVGTWGPPMRTGNVPEIVVIKLK